MRATSSWSRDSERVVNPTRSANRTVTVRRSSVIAPTVSGLPQYPQNRKRSGLSSRHLGQINTAKGWVPILEEWVQAVGNTSSPQARYTLCTLRQSRYPSFIVATAGPSSEAAYVNRQSERAKPFKMTATAHSQAAEAQRSPPPDLGPLPGYARARPPGCLPDQVGRAAASRAGSGRLPPGGPSGKPPASPWTGHRIDRLLTQAVTSARNLHSRRSTRAITSSTPSIASWTVAIASGIVLLSLPPVCTRPNPATPAWLRRPGGSATSTGSTRAAARVG